MSQTALVLIEYQNDFLSEGGALHEASGLSWRVRICSRIPRLL